MIVCTVALATQQVHPTVLGDMLSEVDAELPRRIEASVGRWCGSWFARSVVPLFMQRPAWLIPASLALLATGAALSVSRRAASERSRRRS